MLAVNRSSRSSSQTCSPWAASTGNVTKGRMQTADGLTKRCRRYIDGIRAH